MKKVTAGGILLGSLLICGAASASEGSHTASLPAYYGTLQAHEAQPGDDKGKHEKQPEDDRGRSAQSSNAGGQEVRVRIALRGNRINGELPQGHAEYRTASGRVGLRVEVEDVNLPNGTPLLIAVDGTPAGMLTLVSGAAELELNS